MNAIIYVCIKIAENFTCAQYIERSNAIRQQALDVLLAGSVVVPG